MMRYFDSKICECAENILTRAGYDLHKMNFALLYVTKEKNPL